MRSYSPEIRTMKNPGLPEPLWEILDGSLWHATGRNGLQGILADGEIRITGDRYKNSLCRKLKCVALFDFGPSAVDRWNQFNNLERLVRPSAGGARRGMA